MKKLIATIILCVLTATTTIAQTPQRWEKMRNHFERLDSATQSHILKKHKDFWEKQLRKNDKKWRKQMAHMWGERSAQFVGGEKALVSWIENNITYPLQADINDIEGKVVVTFDVNTDGTISNLQVKESASTVLDGEVVNKLEAMPRWIPARQNGRPVKMTYTLPIHFSALPS